MSGLILQIKLAPLQRGSKVAPQILALLEQEQHRTVERSSATASIRLGCVKSNVRGFHQLLAIGPVLRPESNSDTRADEDGNAVDDERLLERVDQRSCEALGFRRLILSQLDDGELIAGIPVRGFAVLQRVADSTRCELKKRVACSMTERVVDRFEIVEVDLQQGGFRLCSADGRERLL